MQLAKCVGEMRRRRAERKSPATRLPALNIMQHHKYISRHRPKLNLEPFAMHLLLVMQRLLNFLDTKDSRRAFEWRCGRDSPIVAFSMAINGEM